MKSLGDFISWKTTPHVERAKIDIKQTSLLLGDSLPRTNNANIYNIQSQAEGANVRIFDLSKGVVLDFQFVSAAKKQEPYCSSSTRNPRNKILPKKAKAQRL